MYYERSIGDQILNLAGLVFALFFINMIFDFVGISWMDVPEVFRGYMSQLGGQADKFSAYTNRYPIGF